jgi:hypothetical protein
LLRYQPGLRDGLSAYALGLAYRVSGDTRYAAAAKMILLAWVRVYNRPAPLVGHLVAEPLGPMIKLFITFDLIQDALTPTEQRTVRNWARQWLDSGKRATDSARDNPWLANSVYGGMTTNVAAYGNSPMGQRAMAVWAAAVAGEPYLTQTLEWNWRHVTSGGNEYGWDDVIEHMIIPATDGETVEGRYRQSTGYGLFAWADLVLIADVARHAGFGQDLFGYTTSSGKSLLSVAPFYGPILSGERSSPYATETFLYGVPAQIHSKYRAIFEIAYKNCPTGNQNCDAVRQALATGGDAVRGANDDAHIYRWNAVLGQPLDGATPATTTTTTTTTTFITPPPTTGPTPPPTVAPPPADSNLAPNPDFETDPSAYTSHGTGSFSWATDQAHSGSHALKLATSDFSLNRWMVSIPANPGERYQISAWVMSTAGSASIAANFWQGSSYIGATDETPAASGPWRELTLDVTAPAGTDRLRVELRNAWSAGTRWFDDLSITRQ